MRILDFRISFFSHFFDFFSCLQKRKYMKYRNYGATLTMFFDHFCVRDKKQEISSFLFGIFPIWNIDQHPDIQNRLLVITYVSNNIKLHHNLNMRYNI
jgi:hypothetical protein